RDPFGQRILEMVLEVGMKAKCWAIVLTATLSALSPGYSNAQSKTITLSGDIRYVHDPSIIKDGDTWYEFGTANGPVRDGELPVRCSPDLHQWKRCGNAFDRVPGWINKLSPATKELWAPDISFFN